MATSNTHRAFPSRDEVKALQNWKLCGSTLRHLPSERIVDVGEEALNLRESHSSIDTIAWATPTDVVFIKAVPLSTTNVRLCTRRTQDGLAGELNDYPPQQENVSVFELASKSGLWIRFDGTRARILIYTEAGDLLRSLHPPPHPVDTASGWILIERLLQENLISTPLSSESRRACCVTCEGIVIDLALMSTGIAVFWVCIADTAKMTVFVDYLNANDIDTPTSTAWGFLIPKLRTPLHTITRDGIVMRRYTTDDRAFYDFAQQPASREAVGNLTAEIPEPLRFTIHPIWSAELWESTSVPIPEDCEGFGVGPTSPSARKGRDFSGYSVTLTQHTGTQAIYEKYWKYQESCRMAAEVEEKQLELDAAHASFSDNMHLGSDLDDR